MEKVIYENETSKLVASVNGGVAELIQSIGGEVVGSVSIYYEEVKELNDFLSVIKEGY